MTYQLKSVAMHITNECSHRCPMCYATPEGQVKCEGNLNILKKIAVSLKESGVEEINLVGGDPAEYSQSEELIKYLSELGFRVLILSNTHNYRNSSVEAITPYVTSLEGTFHAPSAKEHDEFCSKPGAYQILIGNLQRYNALKTPEQQLGVVMNVMKHNYNSLYDTTEAILEQGLPVDYVLVQRIGPYGKALGTDEFAMTKEEIIVAFENIDRINKALGIETSMVDAFPYCVVPKKYHQYLAKCDWGYGTGAVDMHGNLSRCALSSNYTLGNVLQTPVSEIWQTSPVLQSFRSKEYLRNECQECDMLSLCGGGCAMSCGDDSLSNDILVRKISK